MSESKTSEQRIAAVERHRQALELRKAGLSYRAIADQLGYSSVSGCYKAIRAALHAVIAEPAAEVLALELQRLDDMLAGLWVEARRGNVLKVDRVLRIMARRADLLGLDAPKTVKVVQDEAQRLADQYGLDAKEILALAEEIVAGAS